MKCKLLPAILSVLFFGGSMWTGYLAMVHQSPIGFLSAGCFIASTVFGMVASGEL